MNSRIFLQSALDNDRIMSPEEEERFGACLRRVLITDRPNPTRKGCPDRKVIRDIVFHRWTGDPTEFERIASHLADCSPCVREALVDVEEYKQERKRRRTRIVATGIAAAVVLAVASWAILRLLPRQEVVDKSRNAPIQSPASSLIANAGNQQTIQREAPTLESVTIEIPSTWRGPAHPRPPIVLPRGHLARDPPPRRQP